MYNNRMRSLTWNDGGNTCFVRVQAGHQDGDILGVGCTLHGAVVCNEEWYSAFRFPSGSVMAVGPSVSNATVTVYIVRQVG